MINSISDGKRDDELIAFPCPICHNEELTTVFKDTLKGEYPDIGYNFTPKYTRTYQIVKCEKCNHMHASPRHKNIYECYEDIVDHEYLRQSQERKRTFEKVVTEIAKFKKNGFLLDIGCSCGDFIEVSKKRYQVEGIELSKWAYDLAVKKGFRVYNKKLEDLKFDKQFDIVTLFGVIEHLEHPKEELIRIKNILNKGGIVVLWTGDFSALVPKLLGRKWWYYQGQHIQFFSAKSITKLFESVGFKRRKILTYPYVMSLKDINNSLKRYPRISKLVEPILTSKLLSKITITVKLPGEMFAFFEKE